MVFHNMFCTVIFSFSVLIATGMATEQQNLATFEDVQKAGKDPNVVIIDVREPKEIEETGVIPGSINIPLAQLENSLKLTDEEFRKIYKHYKPQIDTPIIVSCRSGNRSAKAYEILKELGFTNLRNFKGGWMEWENKSK